MLPRELFVANSDLIIIFGNLLDNAEAACEAVEQEQRSIRLQAYAAEEKLTIRMENPAATRRSTPRITGLDRGIGLHVLEKIAKKYHGSFLYGEQDGCFRSELTLQSGEVQP